MPTSFLFAGELSCPDPDHELKRLVVNPLSVHHMLIIGILYLDVRPKRGRCHDYKFFSIRRTFGDHRVWGDLHPGKAKRVHLRWDHTNLSWSLSRNNKIEISHEALAPLEQNEICPSTCLRRSKPCFIIERVKSEIRPS